MVDMRGVMGVNYPEYICTTLEQIQLAVNYIGTGRGVIILNGTAFDFGGVDLDIDGGGDYIIKGMGDKCIIDVGATSGGTINITSAKSVILQDFKMNLTAWTGGGIGISVDEFNDNPVLIQNIRFLGSNNLEEGVRISSDNTTIRNCFFEDLGYGIRNISGDYCTIEANYYRDCYDYGVYIAGDHCSVRSNIIYGDDDRINNGIYVINSNYCTIQGNVIAKFVIFGVAIISSGVGSDYNNVTGNTISDGYRNSVSATSGIAIVGGCSYNNVTGNITYTMANSGTGAGFGISINGVDDIENTIVGNNTAVSKTSGLWDAGTDTFEESNNKH